MCQIFLRTHVKIFDHIILHNPLLPFRSKYYHTFAVDKNKDYEKNDHHTITCSMSHHDELQHSNNKRNTKD